MALEKYYSTLIDPDETFNEKYTSYVIGRIKAIALVNRIEMIYKGMRHPDVQNILSKLRRARDEIKKMTDDPSDVKTFKEMGVKLVELESLIEDLEEIQRVIEKEKKKEGE